MSARHFAGFLSYFQLNCNTEEYDYRIKEATDEDYEIMQNSIERFNRS